MLVRRLTLNTPLLPCHPDRQTITSTNNTLCLRTPRGCSSDQPRVMAGLSGWLAFSGDYLFTIHIFKHRPACYLSPWPPRDMGRPPPRPKKGERRRRCPGLEPSGICIWHIYIYIYNLDREREMCICIMYTYVHTHKESESCAMLCYVTWCYVVMLCYVLRCVVMLLYVMWWVVMLCDVMLCYACLVVCHVILWFVMLCYVLLCDALLCDVMLCYAMLCYVYI